MLNDKNFGIYVIGKLRELCKKCDKVPELTEQELHPLPKYESITKWQTK